MQGIDIEEEQDFFINLPGPSHFAKDENKEDLKRILGFLARNVVILYGKNYLRRKYEEHPGNNLLNFITWEDAAYILAVRENGMDVWKQEMELKKDGADQYELDKYKVKNQAGMSDEDRLKYHKLTPKFTQKKGVRCAFSESRWSQEGVLFYQRCLKKLVDFASGEDMYERLELVWEEYVEETGFGVHWREKTSLSTNDNAQSDEEDVFEFELPEKRGLGKGRGPSKDSGLKGRGTSSSEGEKSVSDDLSDSSSESSDSEEDIVRSGSRKRICRAREKRTHEDLTEVLNGGSTSEEEYE